MFHLSSLKCTEMDPSSNDDVPPPKKKMPNNKRKYSYSIRGGDYKPSSNANASNVPVAYAQQSTMTAAAHQSEEASNPYKKMWVGE